MGDLSFKCIKISQNFSSHALKFDSSSSQDPLLRGNFQFASRTLRKSRLDSENPYLNTCWVPPPHTHTNCCVEMIHIRHDLKDSEYSNLKEKGSTPLNKLSIGIHANIVLRDRNSTPHVTIFWKFFGQKMLKQRLNFYLSLLWWCRSR